MEEAMNGFLKFLTKPPDYEATIITESPWKTVKASLTPPKSSRRGSGDHVSKPPPEEPFIVNEEIRFLPGTFNIHKNLSMFEEEEPPMPIPEFSYMKEVIAESDTIETKQDEFLTKMSKVYEIQGRQIVEARRANGSRFSDWRDNNGEGDRKKKISRRNMPLLPEIYYIDTPAEESKKFLEMIDSRMRQRENPN